MIQAMLGDLFQWNACQAFSKTMGAVVTSPPMDAVSKGHRTHYEPDGPGPGWQKTAMIRFSVGVWMLRGSAVSSRASRKLSR